MVTWNDTEWDNATTDDGMVHENTAGTSYDDASEVRQGYSTTVPVAPANCLFWCPLQESSGTTVNDFSGNGNDFTYDGPTLADGSLVGANAAGFDGTDDEITQSSLSFPGSDSTQNVWVYIESLDGGDAYFFTSDQGSQWLFYYNDDTELRLLNGGTSGTVSTSLSTNTWNMLTAVHEWDNGSVEFYVNGSSVGTGDMGGEITADGNIEIGYDGYSGSYNQQLLAMAGWWNVELSAAQIQTLYDIVATRGRLITQEQTL